MKKILLLIFLLSGSLLYAQKNRIRLNQDGQTVDKNGREENSQMLPNQKILLEGELKKPLQNPEKISMLVYASSQAQATEVKAAPTTTGYRALIGPFLPRETVGLEIYVEKTQDDAQKQLIRNQIAGGLPKAAGSLSAIYKSNNTGLTPDEFKAAMLKAFQETLPNDLNIYYVGDKKLKDSFVEIFTPLSATSDYLNLLNTSLRLANPGFAPKADSLKKVMDTETDKIFSEGLKNLVAKEITAAQTLDVSVIVSEVMYYASFDITPAMTFLGNSRPDSVKRNFGMFFTISPYLFARIPPDVSLKDYVTAAPAKSFQRFHRAVAYLIQPTVGVGIMGNKDVKLTPIIYAGGTLRFNQLFKFTYGVALNSKDKYNTLGLSININYFGDILKAFQTAQANSKF
ncbi:hypothetical protein [Emticicia fluvialis]|uniref:hypothetical protein n=1 Tax=Emticicia fluvialis TaxID=2974474 RepID=UPI002165289C|nr:hypothetical protein [Emticicia fluvialis]